MDIYLFRGFRAATVRAPQTISLDLVTVSLFMPRTFRFEDQADMRDRVAGGPVKASPLLFLLSPINFSFLAHQLLDAHRAVVNLHILG